MKKCIAAFVAVAAITGPAGSYAQEYPIKPIRIILPFAPGAGTDLVARLLAQRFTAAWGQPALVDNRAGAGGNIGAELVVRSPPDGHTLLMSTASLTVNVTRRHQPRDHQQGAGGSGEKSAASGRESLHDARRC